jgi:hypothetical protein
MARPQIVIPVPPPPVPSQSALAIPDGKAAGAYNVGGIVVIPSATGAGITVGPGFRVPVGMYVRIRGHNGASAGNTGNCYVAHTREDVNGPSADTIEPNTEIIYPVDNLRSIWVRSLNAGDGVTISVRSS